LMSGDFFSCLKTLRVPLSECFIIYSLTDCVVKSRVKLVEVLGVEPKSCVATIESEAPPNVFVNLFLSPLEGVVGVD